MKFTTSRYALKLTGQVLLCLNSKSLLKEAKRLRLRLFKNFLTIRRLSVIEHFDTKVQELSYFVDEKYH